MEELKELSLDATPQQGSSLESDERPDKWAADAVTCILYFLACFALPTCTQRQVRASGHSLGPATRPPALSISEASPDLNPRLLLPGPKCVAPRTR